MKTNFIPFELERQMSIWENTVQYNLSESGVHPLSMRELVDDPQELERILDSGLNYPQTNGLPALRQRIAAIYRGAAPQNVLVTTGAAQANFTALLSLLDPGDQIAVMLPNYMQIWGAAQNLGLDMRTFALKEDAGWRIDPDDLHAAVTPRTRLIAVCNPNNPSGHILSEEEMDWLVQAAQSCGAWLLADEVYAGAERLQEEITPSFWGLYERVLAIGSMSKAYGLPGLRLGWVVAPPGAADELWARQDYITISTTWLANQLAEYALRPAVRQRLIARTRRYIRDGYANFESWLARHPGLFNLVPPQAAAIAFVRYQRKIGSQALVDHLRQEQSAYVVPGAHFGLDHHLRLSYGMPVETLNEGLERLYRVLSEVE
jgi:aspartate/methionine/tyrosine aminotransferase